MEKVWRCRLLILCTILGHLRPWRTAGWQVNALDWCPKPQVKSGVWRAVGAAISLMLVTHGASSTPLASAWGRAGANEDANTRMDVDVGVDVDVDVNVDVDAAVDVEDADGGSAIIPVRGQCTQRVQIGSSF